MNSLLIVVVNYFNDGERSYPTLDAALDRHVDKLANGSRLVNDVIRHEYTDWRKGFYDRGSVSQIHTLVRIVIGGRFSITNERRLRLCVYRRRVNKYILRLTVAIAKQLDRRSYIASTYDDILGLLYIKTVMLYMAQYPVRWTTQSALHFGPWLTCSFRHQLRFSGKQSSIHNLF